MSSQLLACTLAAPIALTGCSTECNQGGHFAVEVSLRDARTHAIVCEGAKVLVMNSDGYQEDLSHFPDDVGEPPCLFNGAFERPSTYSLDISAPGYLPQQRSNIVVPRRDDVCGTLDTRTVIVDLEPDPNAPPIGDAGAEGG